MFLSEIFEPIEKDVKLAEPYNMARLNQRRQDKFFTDAPLSGGGMYSAVTPTTGTEQDVAKASHMPTSLKDDAFYNYVQSIKHRIGTNPYFPYIRSVTLAKDPTGLTKTIYRMPQLVKGDDPRLTRGIVISLATRTVPELETYFNSDYWQNSLSGYNKEEQKKFIWRALAEKLRGVVDEIANLYHKTWLHNISKFQNKQTTEANITEFNKWFGEMVQTKKWAVTDPKLIEALTIIAILSIMGNFKFDFEHDNIMIRLLNTGPQLVLNDPIHDSLRSIIN